MSKAKSKLYIAYGSNLNLVQMKHRCPTAEVVGTSCLSGFKLTFRGNGGGVATVESEEDASVPVLIWRIYPSDEKALDLYEGVPHLYRKETMSVTLNGKHIRATIYIMNDGYPISRPGFTYYHTILEGYRSAGFDQGVLDAFVNESRRKSVMTDRIREQIMAIRDSGETNMLDVIAVQFIALRKGYHELECYIEDHRREYVHFILTGEES